MLTTELVEDNADQRGIRKMKEVGRKAAIH